MKHDDMDKIWERWVSKLVKGTITVWRVTSQALNKSYGKERREGYVTRQRCCGRDVAR